MRDRGELLRREVEHDEEASALALTGLAMLAARSQDFAQARMLLTTAERAASAFPKTLARVRVHLAAQLAIGGELDHAAQKLTAALPDLSVVLLGKALCNLGNIYGMSNLHREAAEQFEAAMLHASAHDQPDLFVAAANGAGLISLRSGDLTDAEANLRRSLLVAQDEASAAVEINLAVCLARQGFVANAIVHADHATSQPRDVPATILADAAEVFLGAYVPERAKKLIDGAAEKARLEQSERSLAPVLFEATARVALADGDLKTALQAAQDACDQPIPAPAAAAIVRVLTSSAPRPPIGLTERDALVAQARFSPSAASIRACLRALAASALPDTTSQVIQAWASSELALQEGSFSEAEHHLHRTMDLLERHLAPIGSLEIRARAQMQIVPLAHLIAQFAVRSSQPGALGACLLRANRMLRQRTDIGHDSELLSRLTELRSASSPAPWQRKALTDRIRQLSWSATTNPRSSEGAPQAEEAGTDVFFAEFDGRIIGQDCDTGLPVDLMSVRSLRFLTSKVQLSLSLLSQTVPGPTPRSIRGVRNAAMVLDASLLRPLGVPTAGSINIHPSPSMGTVPWRLLPTVHDLAVRVGAQSPPRPHPTISSSTPVLICVGPDLESDRHAHELAELYVSATVLTGAQATVGGVLDAMGETDLVHFMAHGITDESHTMLSHLRFFDGPLTLYDIDIAARVPPTVIMSSCEIASASNAHHSGYGFANVFASKETGRVVASSTVVSERHTKTLNMSLHRRLICGEAPEVALNALESTDEVQSIINRVIHVVT